MVRSIAALPHRGLLACHCPRKLRPSRARGCVTSASADGKQAPVLQLRPACMHAGGAGQNLDALATPLTPPLRPDFNICFDLSVEWLWSDHELGVVLLRDEGRHATRTLAWMQLLVFFRGAYGDSAASLVYGL